MFLTVAILMVLLTHLLPLGLAMMAVAVVTLTVLASTHRRPQPVAEPAGEPVEEQTEEPADRYVHNRAA